MRTVELPGFHLPASVVGFGCASLGSRVSPSQGLSALAQAHEAGVNWFDVAPAYGAGDAETILGTFVRGKRDRMLICTKVGLAPPQRNAWLKSIYAVARPAAATLKGLRKAFRRMPATRNVSIPLTPQMIVDSLDRSLKRLGTDYVDVYALHKPASADITREDLLETLVRLRRAGKIKHIGMAGDYAAAALALQHPDVYTAIQVADDPLSLPLASLRAQFTQPCALISHSILGVDGTRERLLENLRNSDTNLKKRLLTSGYESGLEQTASELLVDRALAANNQGVVLLSMFGAKHRAQNLARAEGPVRLESTALVADILSVVPHRHSKP